MRLPLEKRLKKLLHVKTGLLQDEVIQLVYEIDSKAVLHGGTSIWRCYGGNRFSEDLDFYSKQMDEIAAKLSEKAQRQGLTVVKLKKTDNALYCRIISNGVEVRLEATNALKTTPVLASYEKMDGSMLQILSLSPEQLLLEKINAYKNRRLARDAYDLLHLSGLTKNSEQEKKEVRRLLEKIENPLDEENLKAIIYAGAIPSFAQIMESLSRRYL